MSLLSIQLHQYNVPYNVPSNNSSVVDHFYLVLQFQSDTSVLADNLSFPLDAIFYGDLTSETAPLPQLGSRSM